MFVVSSKNNFFIKDEEHLLLSLSHPMKSYEKSNMDNFISPEARLAYSMECLLFALEKKGIERKQAVELLEMIEEVPLLSHLAIRKSVD